MAAGPEAHLAFVGDGPVRPDLERHFAGTNTTFMVNPPARGILLQSELSSITENTEIR